MEGAIERGNEIERVRETATKRGRDRVRETAR